METAMEKLKKFTLEGVAQLITCPMLICWGEQDKLTPREVARKLHDSVGSKDKTLKIFTVKEGGAEHCQVDNRQIATDYIADWLEARLR
jgi:esterase/lipase